MWGTDFKTNIFLKRIIVKNIQEVKNLLEEKQEELDSINIQLIMYASSSPSEILSNEDKEDSISSIYYKIRELLRDQEEVIKIIHDLNHCLEYLEEGGTLEKKNYD